MFFKSIKEYIKYFYIILELLENFRVILFLVKYYFV